MRHVAILVLTALLAFGPGSATAEVMQQKVPNTGTVPVTPGITIIPPDLVTWVQAYQDMGCTMPIPSARDAVFVEKQTASPGTPPAMYITAKIKNIGGAAGKSKSRLWYVIADGAAVSVDQMHLLPATWNQFYETPAIPSNQGFGLASCVKIPLNWPLTRIRVGAVADMRMDSIPEGGQVKEKNEENNYGDHYYIVKRP